MDIKQYSPQSGEFVRKDNSVLNYALKDGFHTTSTELNALAEGVSYVGGRIFENVATNGVVNMHLKTGAKKCVMTYEIETDAKIYYGLVSGATVTVDGTDALPVSRNQVTVVPKTANLYYTPTFTGGTILVQRTNGAAGGPAKGGASGGDTRTVVIPPNTSILIQVTNKSNTAGLIGVYVEWLEA